MQEGATALARVHQIEEESIKQHGEFDREKLPEALQDECDSLCTLLDRLGDMGEWIDWDDYKAQREEGSV